MPTRRIEPFDPADHKSDIDIPCFSPYHRPPTHMVYKPGKYEHVCPSCGRREVFTVRRITA